MIGPTDEEIKKLEINDQDLQILKPSLREILSNYQETQRSFCSLLQQSNQHSKFIYTCQGSHKFCKSCFQTMLENRYLRFKDSVDYYCPYCNDLFFYRQGLKKAFLVSIFSAFENEAVFTNIPLDNYEAQQVIEEFKKTITRFEVVKVERVKNIHLKNEFRQLKQNFYRKGFKGKIGVWHGSDSEEKYRRICDDGFLIGGNNTEVRNGDTFGRGVYTCTDAYSCLNYAGESRCLLFCKGLIGGDSDTTRTPNIFIFRNSFQVIPRFLVMFR
jgi:hypothetical protein